MTIYTILYGLSVVGPLDEFTCLRIISRQEKSEVAVAIMVAVAITTGSLQKILDWEQLLLCLACDPATARLPWTAVMVFEVRHCYYADVVIVTTLMIPSSSSNERKQCTGAAASPVAGSNDVLCAFWISEARTPTANKQRL